MILFSSPLKLHKNSLEKHLKNYSLVYSEMVIATQSLYSTSIYFSPSICFTDLLLTKVVFFFYSRTGNLNTREKKCCTVEPC